MQENIKLVWLFIGDTRQTLPIVTRGRAEGIINATLTLSELWESLHKRFLTVNRRLTMTRTGDMSDADFAHHCLMQKKWAKSLLAIGEGVPNESVQDMRDFISIEPSLSTKEIYQKYGLPVMQYYTTAEESIDRTTEWLYPNKNVNDPNVAKHRVILAITNERVNYWKTYMQSFNTNESNILQSHDYYADVDDDNGILRELLTDKLLDQLVDNQTPNHRLILKVGDICLIKRPMRPFQLASNQRLFIKNIRLPVIDFHQN